MTSANPSSIASLFEQESASRSNTNPNPYKLTRDRIAQWLSVAADQSKGLHVNLYRNLSRLDGKGDAPFVFLEWKLGDDLLSGTDLAFYDQEKEAREAAAISKILDEAHKANLKSIVVGLRDEPPGGPVERRIAAFAYREGLYPNETISKLSSELGLGSEQLVVWPAMDDASVDTREDYPLQSQVELPAAGWSPTSMLHTNLVLEGVPGTGKTHWVKSTARSLFSADGGDIGALGDGAFAITLHPATSYEDFVEGLRPGHATPTLQAGVVRVDDEDVVPSASTDRHRWFFCPADTDPAHQVEQGQGPLTSKPAGAASSSSFRVHDGFFLRACAHAVARPDKGFVVLLDEFNRCNVPKVFGDLLTTLEPSKRATWTPEKGWNTRNSQVVTLPYSGRRFFVPSNVVVIATMNTTDRSITGLDGALRRRFAFERVWPLGFRNDGRTFKINELLGELDILAAPEVDYVFEPHAPATPDLVAESGGGQALASSEVLFQQTLQAWGHLNEQLLEEFGPDGVLGHSYLFDMQRALRRDGRYWSTVNPEETLREAWNKYLLPQLVEVFENGNATSSVNMEMRILKRLQMDLKALGTLRLERPGNNTLLRRISLLIWPSKL